MKNLMLVCFLVFSLSSWAAWVQIDENTTQDMITSNFEGLESSQINFTLSGYDLKTYEISGQSYQHISLSDEGEIVELGKPGLPIISRLLAISANGDPQLEILEIEKFKITDLDLAPRQSVDNIVKNDDNTFLKDDDFYETGGLYPETAVVLGNPAIVRGVRVVSVNINPFQYDPVSREVSVISNISFRITTNRESGINPVTREMKRSRFFEPLLSSQLLNYDVLAGTRDVEYQQPCLMIIYADDELLTLTGGYNLQDVIDWKIQKGFEVHAFNLDETGSSSTSIQNAIQDAYDTWENPPEFVCLVGDPSSYYSLPASNSGYGATDHYYSLMEGDDILPDVFVGRLSVDSSTDMKVIANKILGYEKTPFMEETEWYTDVLLIGDPSSSGPSCVSTMKYIKSMILDYDDSFTFDEYYSGGAGSFFQTSMNEGVSFFAYRGYLGMSGIPSYISSLNNGWMMPFVSCLTCGTGDFDGEDTSEDFLEQGSPNLPKAAIAAVGTATAGTITMYNNIVTGGMFHGIFHDGIYNPGGALARGKFALYDNYWGTGGQSGSQNFFYWNNLMGDPSIELWTGLPQQMNISYNDVISTGTNYLEVYVENSAGQPLANAWVTAYSESLDIFTTDFTDASGLVYLNINADQIGTADLTVTAHNCIPHLGDFNIVQSSYYLGIENIIIDDDMTGNSSGNSDGILQPGETIELGLELWNSGYSQIDGVSATLSSTDPAVTVINASGDYGNIAADATVLNSDFIFALDNSLINGSIIEMVLEISAASGSTWNEPIFLTVSGPDLIVQDYIVSDGSNGVLEPGETSNFKLLIRNNGETDVENITGILTSDDERITINDDQGYWSEIGAGQQVSNQTDMFNISANSAIINGSQIPMQVTLTDPAGMEITLSFNIIVGIVTLEDPLGPDAYGYYCYDDGDIFYPDVPEYNWIEIDPNAANPDFEGTVLDMDMYTLPHSEGGSGDIELVTLPPEFTFQYYGIVYDEISICTNGFINPGYSEDFEFMNWHIPGPLAPYPMIAAFWDELHMNYSSNVVYYYNASEHYIVIEWNDMINTQNDEETFQLIIYDANFYNTTTNDSKIKMQYKEINNTDVNYTGYPHNHGQYATVGITDHTNSIGLEYTYNDDYPTAAKELEDEMALLFAPTPIPTSGPYVFISDLGVFSGTDHVIEQGETAYFSISLKNIGPDQATNVDMELVLDDEYVTITDAQENFGDIGSGDIVTISNAYIMEISELVPDQHFISITAVITCAEEVWERNINLIIYAFPELAFDPPSFSVELDENQTMETTLSLTNIVAGSGALSYELRTEPIEPSSREISNSYVVCNLGTFEPGETVTWTFTAYNWSTDNEWITDINIHFPYGVQVVSSSDFVGGTGGDMVSNGETGENVEINWHGSTALGYGYLHQNQHATAQVSVEIEDFFSGNIVLTYELIGDGYGEDPHTSSGEMTLYYPLGWISVYPPVGVITGGETDVLDVTFDTSQLTYGEYNCEIIINTGDAYEPTIPVTLNVVALDADDPVIPSRTELTGNYPNPFNPETVISFQLSESSPVELQIYNIKGQLVRTLVNSELQAGLHTATWNGSDENGSAVTSGVYFYKMQAGKYSSIKKMILLQ